MTPNWWSAGLDSETLINNATRLAPWMNKEDSRLLVAIDVDTTDFDPCGDGQIWQIGVSAALSWPDRLQMLEQYNKIITVPTTLMADSLEFERWASVYPDKGDALMLMMCHLVNNGMSLSAALVWLNDYMGTLINEPNNATVCGQCLTTNDIPWLTCAYQMPVWFDNLLDTGMLVKSAVIPTVVMPDETDAQFYTRVAGRPMSFRYGVDGFVIPRLVEAGLLRDVPDDSVPGSSNWRNAGWDSGASLRMVQAIREMVVKGGDNG